MSFLKKLLERSGLPLWLLCELPLLAVLLITAALDPAEGYELSSGNYLVYIPATVLTLAFSALLNWMKGFLVLYFGRIGCGFVESGRLLCRIHSLMALLEAASTLILFLLRHLGAYPLISQLQLFGHELIYAFLFMYYLREKSSVSYRRCTVIALLCFLASSAWLMLSVIAAL